MEQTQLLDNTAATYIVMLSAFQVVLNCQLELKGTIYDQGKTAQKVKEAINVLNLKNDTNKRHIWALESKKAADMMYAIQKIGEEIAKGDGVALHAITYLVRKGVDFSKIKIVELEDEDLT